MEETSGVDGDMRAGQTELEWWEAWNQGVPWLIMGAVGYLDKLIRPSFSVFEWGSGGSTIWLAERASQVTSVEHTKGWYEKLSKRLEEEGLANVTLHFLPMGKYVEAILGYPDDAFDLIMIDGRQRVRCIESARTHLKLGGILVLDNAERPRYQAGIALLARWGRKDFRGKWLTSVFLRPGAQDE